MAATLAGAATAPGIASAQQADTLRHEGIEEIVVTAQRREQVLQDVPIAMQVVGNDLIADVAAEDLGDLDGYVPGLVVSSDSPTQPRYQIRGIQTGDFGSSCPASGGSRSHPAAPRARLRRRSTRPSSPAPSAARR